MAEEKREETMRDPPKDVAGALNGVDLGSLLGGLLGGGTASDGAAGAPPSDAVRDGIGAVLRDPQMMAKLPDMIEMLRPMMGNLSGGAAAEAVATSSQPQTVPRHAEQGEGAREEERSTSLTPGGKKGDCHDRRIALLCALRPYLSPRRREVIDYILRMDKMGKLFRNG